MAIERASLMIERATLQTAKLFHIELDDEFVLPLKSMIRSAKKELSETQLQAHEVYINAREMLNRLEAAEIKSPDAMKAIEIQQAMIQQADDMVKLAKEKVKNLEDEVHEFEEQANEDDKRFKAHLKKTNFVPAYGEMTKPACLLGLGIIKRLWKSKRLSFESKDNQYIYIAPDYQPFQDDPPRYTIEYKEMLLCDLIETAKVANGSLEESGDKGKVFDMDEIDKITDTSEGEGEEKSEENKRLGLNEHKSTSKTVKILEFWGTVVSKDGKEKKKNRLMMLANKRFLIRNQENPHKDKRPPYEYCIPMPYPHRGISGSSMVQAEIKLQYTLNNLLNMAIDNLNFTTNTVFEYDPMKLLEPKNMTRIFPGKLIKTKSGVKNENVVKQVLTKGITNDFFKIFEMVSRELQEGTAVNEFLTSMPSKSAKTLGEIEIKTAESHGYFDVIARKIEVNSIRLLLRNCYAMLCDFGDFKNLERYQFNVGGLSLLLLQKQQVEYLVQALSLALKYPVLMQSTDIKDLWERLLGIWNLDDAHREEEPGQMMQQMSQQQQPQQQRPAAPQPGQPPGPQPNAA